MIFGFTGVVGKSWIRGYGGRVCFCDWHVVAGFGFECGIFFVFDVFDMRGDD